MGAAGRPRAALRACSRAGDLAPSRALRFSPSGPVPAVCSANIAVHLRSAREASSCLASFRNGKGLLSHSGSHAGGFLAPKNKKPRVKRGCFWGLPQSDRSAIFEDCEEGSAGSTADEQDLKRASEMMGAAGRIQNVRHEVAGGNCLYHGTIPTAE